MSFYPCLCGGTGFPGIILTDRVRHGPCGKEMSYMITYIVKPGDSVFSIAGEYGTAARQVIDDNGLSSASELVPGQALVILYPERTVTVNEGDTLASIAAAEGVTENSILRNNPALRGSSMVTPGQELTLSFTEPKLGSIATNGYAYTSVDRNVLAQTLPYLTYLTIFTYGFAIDGSLIEPEGDEELIAIARSYGTAPIMMLSTLTAEGNFSNQLSNALFSSEEAQLLLIDNLLDTIKSKGYYGLDIDFEYVFPTDADAFAEFMERLTARMTPEGIPVWISLAPKTSSTQPGLLYEAHNYAELGEIADFSTVMTYEWGYRYGPPMAVAPLNKVRQVIDYAVTQIEPSRIFMGIPNYGYDWTLPFVSGESAAPSIGNEEALKIAFENGAEILFDEIAASPYFFYYDDGARHEVWFEDARSIEAKLGLIRSRGLAGGAWWNIMRPFVQNWTVTNALYDIVRVL